MPTDRTQLQHELAEHLGPPTAAALMEHLPVVPAAELATRAELFEVHDRLHEDLRDVKVELRDLKGDVRDLQQGLHSLRGHVQALDARLDTTSAGLRTEMGELRAVVEGQVPRLVATMVATVAALMAIAGGAVALTS